MNKISLASEIVIYENVMDVHLDILSELSYIFEKYNQDWATSTINDKDYSNELRSCVVYSLHPSGLDLKLDQDKKRINDIMNHRLSKAIFDYVKTYNLKIREKEPWEILKYEEGNKLVWHKDGGEHHPCDISFVYYFNDDYTGGEIQFQDWLNGEPYKPKANSLIIFPSDERYIHRVIPVTSGIKYNAISFAK